MSDWDRFNDQFRETEEEKQERWAKRRAAKKVDPRDPDPSRSGIFRDHNCWRCNDGREPCVTGGSARCPYPHARND